MSQTELTITPDSALKFIDEIAFHSTGFLARGVLAAVGGAQL